MSRLESQISQAEVQAHAAEAARTELQHEVQHLSQTLEETQAAAEQHMQVQAGTSVSELTCLARSSPPVYALACSTLQHLDVILGSCSSVEEGFLAA